MLTQARLKELLHYEPGTGVFTWKPGHVSGWATKKSRDAGYDFDGYRRIKIDKKNYLCHRLAWLWIHGEFPSGVLDHINGEKSDNRIENLRKAIGGQNIMNVQRKLNNTSGHKGVFWKKSIEKWQVAVGANGKQHHIGYFLDKEDAINAAISARNRLHGEFARHE